MHPPFTKSHPLRATWHEAKSHPLRATWHEGEDYSNSWAPKNFPHSIHWPATAGHRLPDSPAGRLRPPRSSQDCATLRRNVPHGSTSSKLDSTRSLTPMEAVGDGKGAPKRQDGRGVRSSERDGAMVTPSKGWWTMNWMCQKRKVSLAESSVLFSAKPLAENVSFGIILRRRKMCL